MAYDSGTRLRDPLKCVLFGEGGRGWRGDLDVGKGVWDRGLKGGGSKGEAFSYGRVGGKVEA
jgi:hypothetical protein